MPGPGTLVARGIAEGKPLALDLTRLVSRVGRGPDTGIDRVERAYLRAVLAGTGKVAGAVRVGRSVYLLDRAGMVALAARLEGDQPWGAPGMLSRLGLRTGKGAAAADVARLACAAGRPVAMAARLAALLGGRGCYLNVGHTHLEDPWLPALGRAGLGRAVMIHDLIPIEHPEWSGAGAPERFGARLAAALGHADLLVTNSRDTAGKVAAQLARAGRRVPVLAAALGLEPLPRLQTPSPLLAPGVPAFMTLGTIEPRKNHALLFQAWEIMAADRMLPVLPHLHLVGRRGWAGPEVTGWLDRSPLMGACVFEHGGLDDRAAMSLLAGARALLFPSRAEGFGLPVQEAARLGVPVICSPLPALRESLGDKALYLEPDDAYPWVEAITRMASASDRPPASGRETPSGRSHGWEDHFRKVLPALPGGVDPAEYTATCHGAGADE
ncbi:MAG: glycosyltransferase family 4 protein [Rhodobacteraceae bacterium]|nr:glycosyltransferase family 4 protein [Paracoccaceae bacterium]